MEKAQSTNRYRELKERTKLFAKRCRDYVKKLPRTISNIEYGKQLIRSSGSQAANYIEANEALSKKDFSHRTRICRKEAKESGLWIDFTEPLNSGKETQKALFTETEELRKIFSSILNKSN
ncbi:MAG: four helix bundle protein [Candidatus Nealsonbacteria bacterium CG_4_9_14_3_um_filter_37_13]|uniref:Four helix bundle protein n=2 Tax=Candidatus Nealsoniibacteriota TaxID=1817911 RepID=A0A2H0TJ04_9BACT|nr:MAG: four helix bundle protein [Candidatus Nealsonbacteria bacterium CG10_big_fil_rev_8_21_14_0_10_37_25]PJA84758.1 MAG: four helix bundle protein [Candidatus Nealsonbacteria bacterium CG_4_9_14_3_um_filter_37_13]